VASAASPALNGGRSVTIPLLMAGAAFVRHEPRRIGQDGRTEICHPVPAVPRRMKRTSCGASCLRSATRSAPRPNARRSSVNTPPAKAGGFELRLKAGSAGPRGRLDNPKVVIRLRRLLVLDVLFPHIVRHVSA